MLEYMKFTIGGFFQGYTEIEINVKDGIIYATIDHTLRVNFKHEKVLSFTKSRLWLLALDAIGIDAWKDRYKPDDMICDGEQWEINCKFENEPRRHIYGDNAYPENWLPFLNIIKKITPIF